MRKWLAAIFVAALATGGVVALLQTLVKIFKQDQDPGAKAAATGEEEENSFPWGASNKSLLRKDLFSAPRKLGRGYHGETWEVRDLQLRKAVAVKIFFTKGEYVTRSMLDASETLRRKMERWASCNSGLFLKRRSAYQPGRQHICICLESHALDQVVARDVSFVVMELCRGANLRTLLEQQMEKPVGEKQWRAQVRRWMRGLLEGLQYLSLLKPPVMHRDLKLQNVVVEEGEAKIVDFEWAAIPPEPVRLPYAYASPPEVHVKRSKVVRYPAEQAWAFDVWGFGSIYYNLLCSTPGGNMTKVAKAAALLIRKKEAVPKSTFSRSCEDGSLGYGKPIDWRVISHALALLPDRKPPATLLEMMPKPKPDA